MRTVFEEEAEDELAPTEPQHDSSQDRELTISSTTLLAIFFGLVLICGLFFGLGYTLGRRSSSEASQMPSSDMSPASKTESQASGSSSSISKPSAASQSSVASTTAPTDGQAPEASGAAAPEESGHDATGEQIQNPVQTSTAETRTNPAPQSLKQQSPAQLPAQSAATTTQSPDVAQSSAPPAGVMVQIAAISNPADADVLVSALQKRGYSVTTRRVPADPLIHVQVGPFSSRADAVAMRQKLLSDGYNAILK
jgi:DedD protein